MKVCWNLTNACNENCIYCFRELREKPRSLEDNIAILNKLKTIGVTRITFAGGEPLLYKDIKILMAYSKSLGIKNNLITNGSLLNKNNIEETLKNVDKITFSIDSSSAYVNDSIGRGKKHYEHIKEILPFIKVYYPEIEIEVNTVASRLTLSEIDFMFEAIGTELCFYGIKKWKISRFSPLRGYAKERQGILSLTDDTFKRIKDKYDGVSALFDISVRDLDAVDENLIVSPSGSIKKSVNSHEEILVDNILTNNSSEITKKLVLGGYHV